MEKFIFFRIAWMNNYRGITSTDIPIGAGSYVKENSDGGEVYNFWPYKDKLYAFARIQKDRGLRIERLGAKSEQPFIENVTAVFFATNPVTGGQKVVGWISNATLYRNARKHTIKERKHKWFFIEASATNYHLIHPNDRIFEIPSDGPGQTNVWYVEEYRDKQYLQRFKKYMQNPQKGKVRGKKKNTWQRDVKMRLRVELAAMEEVARYFEEREFVVAFRHQEKIGWDLEAKAPDGRSLLLEVKGLSGSFDQVDFTPNEYKCCKKYRNYRICIVSNVLDDKLRKLDIYFKIKSEWRNELGERLRLKILESARFSRF